MAAGAGRHEQRARERNHATHKGSARGDSTQTNTNRDCRAVRGARRRASAHDLTKDVCRDNVEVLIQFVDAWYASDHRVGGATDGGGAAASTSMAVGAGVGVTEAGAATAGGAAAVAAAVAGTGVDTEAGAAADGLPATLATRSRISASTSAARAAIPFGPAYL